ncbi:hypothetical protein DFH09DRAFT_1069535 [Mycena vulgaris]|nr:hypothetical protein DFH09DRAFT_1069535 [Mycena vulgaris]
MSLEEPALPTSNRDRALVIFLRKNCAPSRLTVPILLRAIQNKSATFFRAAVRHLYIDEHITDLQKHTILGVTNLCASASLTAHHQYLADPPLNFFVLRLDFPVSFIHSMFRHVTHLEMLEPTDDFKMQVLIDGNGWWTLPLIPHLTHFAFSSIPLAAIVAPVLRTYDEEAAASAIGSAAQPPGMTSGSVRRISSRQDAAKVQHPSLNDEPPRFDSLFARFVWQLPHLFLTFSSNEISPSGETCYWCYVPPPKFMKLIAHRHFRSPREALWSMFKAPEPLRSHSVLNRLFASTVAMRDREQNLAQDGPITDAGEATASKLWKVCVSEAAKYDKYPVKSWRSTMDGIHFFRGEVGDDTEALGTSDRRVYCSGDGCYRGRPALSTGASPATTRCNEWTHRRVEKRKQTNKAEGLGGFELISRSLKQIRSTRRRRAGDLRWSKKSMRVTSYLSTGAFPSFWVHGDASDVWSEESSE